MSLCNIPSLVLFEDYSGDYEVYEGAAYQAFCDTFSSQQLDFQGLRVAHKRHPEFNKMSATFWHIVTTGEEELNRVPDIRRFERIKWPPYIISCCTKECDKILVWETKRRSENRVLLWCKDIDYLVVLAKRDGYFILWTAYPIDQEHTRKKLQKEYEDYIKTAKTA